MRYLDSLTPATGAVRISRIGLGTWQFGSREWGYGSSYSDREARAIVERAVQLGVTLFDTAEIYGTGRSERILGAALQGHREQAFIATKIFPVLPVAPVVVQRGVASATRLGVSRLDLYQVHQPNPLVRDATTMRGMRQLRDIGLVGEVGVSNYGLSRWQAAEAALGDRVLSNQVPYSLVERRIERDTLGWAAANGRVVIAYSPLAQGLLTGRYSAEHRPSNTVRTANPLFLPENLDRAKPLLGALTDVASEHSATPAQIALAWVLHNPAVVAIPGASSVAQLESNVAAADIELSAEQYAVLTAASDAFTPLRGRAAAGPIARQLVRRSAVGRLARQGS